MASGFAIFLASVGAIVSFLMLWATGANDVGNAFGTGVGSGAFSYRTAVIIAAIFELAGASLIGGNVANFIQSDLISLKEFGGDEELFAAGMFAAAAGTFVWVLTATCFALPVSTTHAIVGAVIAFVIVQGKAGNLSQSAVGGVAAGWFTSPILGGIVSAGIYIAIKMLVLEKPANVLRARRALPALFALTLVTDIVFILSAGPELMRPSQLSTRDAALKVYLPAVVATAIIALLTGRFYLVPWVARNLYRYRAEFPEEEGQNPNGLALTDITQTTSSQTMVTSQPNGGETIRMTTLTRSPDTRTKRELSSNRSSRHESRSSDSISGDRAGRARGRCREQRPDSEQRGHADQGAAAASQAGEGVQSHTREDTADRAQPSRAGTGSGQHAWQSPAAAACSEVGHKVGSPFPRTSSHSSFSSTTSRSGRAQVQAEGHAATSSRRHTPATPTDVAAMSGSISPSYDTAEGDESTPLILGADERETRASPARQRSRRSSLSSISKRGRSQGSLGDGSVGRNRSYLQALRWWRCSDTERAEVPARRSLPVSSSNVKEMAQRVAARVVQSASTSKPQEAAFADAARQRPAEPQHHQHSRSAESMQRGAGEERASLQRRLLWSGYDDASDTEDASRLASRSASVSSDNTSPLPLLLPVGMARLPTSTPSSPLHQRQPGEQGQRLPSSAPSLKQSRSLLVRGSPRSHRPEPLTLVNAREEKGQPAMGTGHNESAVRDRIAAVEMLFDVDDVVGENVRGRALDESKGRALGRRLSKSTGALNASQPTGRHSVPVQLHGLLTTSNASGIHVGADEEDGGGGSGGGSSRSGGDRSPVPLDMRTPSPDFHHHAHYYGVAEAYFAPLTLVSACTVAFAHGGNDVANAVGPYGVIADLVAPERLDTTLPIVLNIAGGVAIVVGLMTYGYRVMETVGSNITKLSLSKAFAAQYGASVSILCATLIGLPISSTAVLIGCVAGVGLADGDRDAVDWKLLGGVVLTWIVTLPCSGAVSALIYVIVRAIR